VAWRIVRWKTGTFDACRGKVNYVYEEDPDARGDLRDVLDEAIAPDDHPDFDDVVHGDQEPEPDDTSGGGTSGSSGSGKTGSKQSAVFDLDISDVVENDTRNGVQPGYRGDNPIRHVGDSHSSYFVYEQYRGGMRAREFKIDHTYTPLTWLACAAGARSTSNPGGSLDDREIWAAWRHAKEEGILGETDPVPWKARLHIAREHDLAETVVFEVEFLDDLARNVYVALLDSTSTACHRIRPTLWLV
jgi:hypothetical protein